MFAVNMLLKLSFIRSTHESLLASIADNAQILVLILKRAVSFIGTSLRTLRRTLAVNFTLIPPCHPKRQRRFNGRATLSPSDLN